MKLDGIINTSKNAEIEFKIKFLLEENNKIMKTLDDIQTFVTNGVINSDDAKKIEESFMMKYESNKSKIEKHINTADFMWYYISKIENEVKRGVKSSPES